MDRGEEADFRAAHGDISPQRREENKAGKGIRTLNVERRTPNSERRHPEFSLSVLPASKIIEGKMDRDAVSVQRSEFDVQRSAFDRTHQGENRT
jgi:hypothetical protein